MRNTDTVQLYTVYYSAVSAIRCKKDMMGKQSPHLKTSGKSTTAFDDAELSEDEFEQERQLKSGKSKGKMPIAVSHYEDDEEEEPIGSMDEDEELSLIHIS